MVPKFKQAESNGYFAFFEQAQSIGHKRKAALMYIDLSSSNF